MGLQPGKGYNKHMNQMSEQLITGSGLTFITFPLLDGTGLVRHGFSTRKGGVSTGCFESLDLSYTRGDAKESVDENFRRAAGFFGISSADIVTGHQTHTANIRLVRKEDSGKGVTRTRDYTDVDGLITDEPGIMLCTSHADCTPLFFVDPVHRAVGLSHSGWKGTLLKIGAHTVERMKAAFGTDPADLVAAIGPCACGSCYEVGPELADLFLDRFGPDCLESEAALRSDIGAGRYGTRRSGVFLRSKPDGKFLMDQKCANERILLEAGLLPEHIAVSDYCTMERADLFYSHRRMGNARGNMAAFLMLDCVGG